MQLLRFQLNKLIRDKMADQMRLEGIVVSDRILSQAEYIPALKAKLKEEVEEVIQGKTKKEYQEECADVLEVVHALIKAVGLTLPEVEQAQQQKRESKGAFNSKLFAYYVEHPQEHPATAYARAQPDKYPEITPE